MRMQDKGKRDAIEWLRRLCRDAWGKGAVRSEVKAIVRVHRAFHRSIPLKIPLSTLSLFFKDSKRSYIDFQRYYLRF